MSEMTLYSSFSLSVEDKFNGKLYEEVSRRGSYIIITWNVIQDVKNTPTLKVENATNSHPDFNVQVNDAGKSYVKFFVKPENCDQPVKITLEFDRDTSYVREITVQQPPLVFSINEKNIIIGKRHCIIMTGARLPKDAKIVLCGLEDLAVEKQYWINDSEMRFHFRALKPGSFNVNLKYDRETISTFDTGADIIIDVINGGKKLSLLPLILFLVPVFGLVLYVISKLTD